MPCILIIVILKQFVIKLFLTNKGRKCIEILAKTFQVDWSRFHLRVFLAFALAPK